jgi:hypothetical protein
MFRFSKGICAFSMVILLGMGNGAFGQWVEYDRPLPLPSADDITGKLYGVFDPTQYKVIICVSGDRNKWFDKTHIQPKGTPQPDPVEAVPIKADGSFVIHYWAGNPNTINEWDVKTPFIGLWVVPVSFDTRWEDPVTKQPIFQIEGIQIPDKVKKAAICYNIKDNNNKSVDQTAVTFSLNAKSATGSRGEYNQVTVYSLDGRKVDEIPVVNREFGLTRQVTSSGSTLARGAYLIVSKSNENLVEIRRMIVTSSSR